MKTLRRPLRELLVAALAVGTVVSCDDATRPKTDGELVPNIMVAEIRPSIKSRLVDPNAVTVQVNGPGVSETKNLIQRANGLWEGRVNVPVGTYEVLIFATAAGELQYFGRIPAVTVNRGTRTDAPVVIDAAIPEVDAPPLPNTTSFSQEIPFSAVPGATTYTVQFSQSPTFAGTPDSIRTTDISPLITVNAVGTWHVRTRAVVPITGLPEAKIPTIPWSDSRSWVVLESDGGDIPGDANPISVVPGTPESVINRNITPTKPADWFDIPVRAGDSLFIETRAQRLTPNASALDTRLTLFRADAPTTQLDQKDNQGTTSDARIVYVAQHTETYKVRVDGVGGTVGHYEIDVEIRRLPAAPSGLTGTVASGTQINLVWADNADNEASFQIERCAGVACSNFATAGSVLANVTTFNNTGLTQDVSYTFRVRAVNSFGVSAPTNTFTVGTFGPTAPSSLTATTTGATEIDLDWQDNATNELGFRIKRCVGVGCTNFTQLVQIATPNDDSYTDATVVYGQAYRYLVSAYNNVMESVVSDTVNANTFPPAAPTSLGVNVMGPTTLQLDWVDNANNETGFEIQRCTGDACSNYQPIDTVAANVTTFQDLTVLNNTGYRYRVRTFNVILSQDFSNVANGDTRPPVAVTGLGATTVSGTSISLAWTDNSDDENGFSVQRCTGAACTNFQQINFSSTNATGYTDNGVLVDSTYRYQIVAMGIAGSAAPSNIAAANTLRPAAPSSLVATTITADTIRLTWTDNANNETGFTVLRCTGVACTPSSIVATRPAGTITWDDTTANLGVSYSYRVFASNVAGNSANSNTATANTFVPATPTALTTETISGSTIAVRWTNNAPEATLMRVERCADAGCPGTFVEIGTVSIPTDSLRDGTATINHSYQYRVRAQNAAGLSAYSNVGSANTLEAAAPTSVTATTTSPTVVQLAWVASTGPGVTGYEIQRCSTVGCSNFAFLTGVAANVLFIDDVVGASADVSYRVRSVNIVGPGPFSTIVNGNTRAPADPTGLAASIVSGAVRLNWTDNADNDASVVIERCVGLACGGVDFVTLTTVNTANLTQYDDQTVAPNNSYTYRLRATNAAGSSNNTNEATANTLYATPASGLSATTFNNSRIDLTWTDNGGDETGFVVERCTGDGCSNFAPIDTLAINAAAFSDVGLSVETSYTYRIRSLNAFGLADPSNTATATTRIPVVPTSLTATTLSNTSIYLTWSDNSDNELNFDIERCDGAGCSNFGVVISTAPNETNFTNPSLSPDTEYSYRIRATNASGSSAWSNIATATTNVPAIPTALSATIVNATDLDLNWTDNATTETSYEVERCAGAGCSGFANVATLAANAQTYPDAGLTPGETYRYRVRAVNAAGSSNYSTVLDVTAGAPVAPSALTAVPNSQTQVHLAWSDNSNNEGSFVIERCDTAGCSNFAFLTSVIAGTTSFNDNTVTANNDYRYRVTAENAAGSSAASNEAAGHTKTPVSATSVVATTITSTQIDLSWVDNSPYETSYEVERCTGAACSDFATIATLAADANSYSDVGLTAGLTYRYRIRAVNNFAVSTSATVSAATNLPANPTALTALATSATEITIDWVDNANNETDYVIERCEGTGCSNFTTLQLLGANLSDYVDATVEADSVYSYRVQAINLAGASGFSNVATANTFIPNDPIDLIASLVFQQQRITMDWTDKSDNELRFIIERCAGVACGGFTAIDTVAAGVTSFVDSLVAIDQIYSYRVRAENNVGTSGYTPEATVDIYLPLAPDNLVATTVSNSQIGLTWNDNATNEFGYIISACAGVGCDPVGQAIATIAAGSTSYQATGLLADSSYTFRVSAYNGAGNVYSPSSATATTIGPSVPTDLTVTVVSANQMDLNWTDNANNELGYRIERCSGVGCSNFVEIGTVGPNVTSFGSTGLNGNSFYTHRIRAFNASATSAYTANVTANTFVPTNPNGLASVTQTANRINLTWNDNASNETGYYVLRCIGAACAVFTDLDTLPAGSNSYSDSTLSENQIARYRVRAFNGVGVSALSAISESNTDVPGDPTVLTAFPNGQTVMLVQWSDNTTEEAGYRIERCAGVGCTNFVQIAQTGPTPGIYHDSTVVGNTHYRYRAYAFGNGRSNYTNIGDGTTILPADPTLLVSIPVSDNAVELSWNDNADNENNYRVLRCEGGGCTNFAQIANLPANTTFVVDASVVANTFYRYIVTATNGAGESQPSNTADAETLVPGLPTNLTATTTTATQIDLAWTDNAVNETGFDIYRCDGPSCTPTFLVSVAADLQAYSDMGLTPSTSYTYLIRAVNANGASGPSNTATASTNPPAAPTGLAAVTTGPTTIDLTWNDNADNEADVRIERCEGTGCSSFTEIAVLSSNVLIFSDPTAVLDSIYTYRVRMTNAAGQSNYSNEATANTYRPMIPTSLAATTISAVRIDLSWTDNANNETGFRVERCAGPGCTSFVEVASVAAGSTGYQDEGLTPGTDYRYQIRAVNIAGDSGYSNIAEATTNIPAAPSTLTATIVSASQIDLAWADNSNNETEFEIDRCVGDGCTNFALYDNAPADATGYIDAGVSLGNSYTYRVRAVGAAGASDYTLDASENTYPPGLATLTTAVPTSPTNVQLAWTAATGSTGHRVYRAVASLGVYSVIADLPASTLDYIDTVNTAEEYTYVIAAYNLAAQSGSSNTLNARMFPPNDASPLGGIALSQTQTGVSWTDNSTDETGFRIERCSGASCTNFAPIAAVGVDTTTYQDEGAVYGERYEYRVIAFNAVGDAAPTNSFLISITEPDAPNSLTATTVAPGQIDLSWTDNASDELGYAVERCTGAVCSDFVQIATLFNDVTSYQNTGLALGAVYRYQVRALNNVGPSGYSNIDQSNTFLPAVVTGLTATVVHGGRIDLSWTDNSINEQGFRIERCVGAGCSDYTQYTTVGANVQNFINNTDVSYGNIYQYRVRAANISGDADPSNVAVGTVILNAPSSLRATTLSRNVVRLTWTDNSSFEGNFSIERCSGVACTPVGVISNEPANTVLFDNSGLPQGVDWTWRVRGVTLGGASNYSNNAGARTPISLPSGVLSAAQADTSQGERHFVLNVPIGALGLRVTQSGGSGDPDLYVRAGETPRTGQVLNDATNCVPYVGGTAETCTFTAPVAGDWYAMMHGFSPYSGTSVKMSLAERFGDSFNYGIGTGMPTDYLVAQELIIPVTFSLTHIGMHVNSILGAAGVKYGLYNNRVGGLGDEPNTLIAQFNGSYAVGLNETVVPEQTLPPGKYWLAILPQSTYNVTYNSAMPATTVWKYVAVFGYANPLPGSWPAVHSSTSFYPMDFFVRAYR